MTRTLRRHLAALLAACGLAALSAEATQGGGAAKPPAALTGKWSRANVRGEGFSSAAVYTFKADGRYELASSVEGSFAGRVSLHETGTFTVKGDQLTFKRTGGTFTQERNGVVTEKKLAAETRTYRWQVGRDAVLGDRSLFLTDKEGRREQLYPRK